MIGLERSSQDDVVDNAGDDDAGQVVGDRAGEDFHMKTLHHRVVLCCVAVIVFLHCFCVPASHL